MGSLTWGGNLQLYVVVCLTFSKAPLTFLESVLGFLFVFRGFFVLLVIVNKYLLFYLG